MVAVGHQHPRVVDVLDLGAHGGVELGQARTYLRHPCQVGEDAPLDGGAVVPVGQPGLVEPGPPGPARVGLVAGLGVPVGVVGLGELVPAPQDGDAAPPEEDGVGHAQGVDPLLAPGPQRLRPVLGGLVGDALPGLGGGLDPDE